MKKAGLIVILVVLLALAGGGWWLYGTIYDSTHFLTTENAQVMADMVAVSPLVTGELSDWPVQEGDMVKAGQVLGRQDTGSMVSNSAMSSSTLGSTADSIASKADIKAPINGMVIATDVVEGQMVAPGTTVATIADVSHMYISANIEETSIFKIKEGQTVDITIDAYPGQVFQGTVTTVGKAANSIFNPLSSITTSGTYSKTTQLIPVQISIVDGDQLTLYPGFNATVKIHIQ